MSTEVKDYLNRIGSVPMLTPQEEIELGRLIQEAQALSGKENLTLQDKRILREGKKAAERMVAANLRLCFNIARNYANNRDSLTILDLAQEGAVGLHRAAERFDPSRGYKFSTFAYWWIRQSITRAITDKDSLIRIPCHRIQELRRFRKAAVEAMKQGVAVNPKQLANDIGVNYGIIELAAITKVVSLDMQVNNNSEAPTPLLELIPDKALDNDDDPALESLPACLDKLNLIDRQVIHRRFYQNMEFKDIEKELGLKSGKASKISQGAVEKLKRLFNQQVFLEQQELAV